MDVDIFGRTAENVAQYMKKGRPILIEGRLKLDQWDDKQTGQKTQPPGEWWPKRFQFLWQPNRRAVAVTRRIAPPCSAQRSSGSVQPRILTRRQP